MTTEDGSEVYVYGALRSGTTMFRLMLQHHPRMSNPGEVDFLFDFLRPDSSHATGWRYDREALEADRIFKAQNLSLPDGMDGLDLLDAMIGGLRDDGRILTLNVHRHAEIIAQVRPDARYIHLIRDPRDVARSVIGMGWAGTLWHGASSWIDTETTWDAVASGLDPAKVFTLRYEDLFRDIEGQLRSLCGFLGVAFDPAMLDYHENSTYSPPDASLVEQWRRRSTPEEIALLESRVAPMLEARGYDLAGTPKTPDPVQSLKLYIGDRRAVWRFGMRRYGAGLYWSEKVARKASLTGWHRNIRTRMEEIALRHLK